MPFSVDKVIDSVKKPQRAAILQNYGLWAGGFYYGAKSQNYDSLECSARKAKEKVALSRWRTKNKAEWVISPSYKASAYRHW